MKVLGPTPGSAAAVRDFIGSTLGDWGCADVVDDARVVASELVTNVIRHARTRATVTLTRADDRIRLAVADEAPITARLDRSSDSDEWPDARGHGLVLVKALSDDWGVDLERRGKSVWAEWEVASTRSAPRTADGA